MSSPVQVTIHASQFPQRVTEDLLQSLRSRQVNHKFHYDSVKQAQRWLALHQACSPFRTEPDCARTYTQCFEAVSRRITNRLVHVIGLGCGGGQKDARLLSFLRDSNKQLFYTPSDVSLPLVLVATEAVQSVVLASHCFPLVCDLARADDLESLIEEPLQRFGMRQPGDALSRFEALPTSRKGHRPTTRPLSTQKRRQAAALRSPIISDNTVATRLLTFFGMIPNFEPDIILPKLKNLLRPDDCLLLSANLAPGPDYSAGIARILPQYDNALTQEWLLTFLLDLGIEKADGQMRFVIEEHPGAKGLKRIAVYFDFIQARSIKVGEESFDFAPNDSIRLFFSYRHTPALIQKLLARYSLEVLDKWISRSEEEGVFLVARTS